MLHDVLAQESPFTCAMDHRASLGAGHQRPQPPQRAVSGGWYGSSQLPKRPTLPSRLSNIRSVSQPVKVVDLTGNGVKSESSNVAAFLGNREKVVSSPDVIKIEDDEERPAKRAKTSGDGLHAGEDGMDMQKTDESHKVMPGSPLPSLPMTMSSVKRVASRRNRLGIEPAARKASGVEPPSAAVRVPPPKKVLDFTPWTGNHPEDVLTESVVKVGFFDKPQGPNQNETNSAKASIWPNLSQKNHHGLSMLGYLFMAVMEKRQVMGKCTAPSTFKPPPRVTVTDTKREAWLRDLANPEVPLRKQSRTIPHGIRGKLLMEQCLSKNIPLQRAVWLAKCVGANELRAFRRKGVSGSAAASGETKWVREWTVHVEQFLESVIATCGLRDWQGNMNYAVKLAAAFYAEKLLDPDHYLDWIISSLAEASLERLPIWIVMTQIYWKDITTYGKRGRRLADAVLEHLHRITESNADVNLALKTRLQKLVAVLAVSNRGCLIIPAMWEKYKYLLTHSSESDRVANTPANNITKRNERLAAPLSKTAANTRSPLLDLYSMLDSLGTDFDFEMLVHKCEAFVPNIAKLVTGLMDWASTPYRTGTMRVYLTARVIAHLHRTESDIDSMIMHYISNAQMAEGKSQHNIHRVIGELVRLEAFSVGRYLQWLMTSGVLTNNESPICATGLISALPFDGQALNVVNTRKMLMRRLGYPADERKAIEEALLNIDQAMTRSLTEYVESVPLSKSLTMSAQLAICHRICEKLGNDMKTFGISVGAFTVACDVIERVQDIACLAMLITDTLATDNSALLATVCDTINLHAESLSALGQFKRLVDVASERYLTLRSQQPLDRMYILALTDLLARLPEKTAFFRLLGDDLTVCEQQNSLAVCSPASDSLIGMHATNLDSDEDIDAFFASGNTMDELLMQRVFSRIMQRAEKPPPPGPEPISRVSRWLNQLESVDNGGVFNTLVHNYLHDLTRAPHEASLPLGPVASLVTSRSVALSGLPNMLKDIKSPQLAASMLHMFMFRDVAGFGLHACEKYRFSLEQEKLQADYADSLITLLRTACEAQDFNAEDPDVIRFIIRCTTTKPGSVRRVFEDGQHSDALRDNARHTLFAILQREHGQNEQREDLDMQSLVSMANAFSVQHCIEAMCYLKTATSWSEIDEKALGDAILASFNNRSDIWPQLLEFAGEITNRTIHEWALDQLLSLSADKHWLEDQYANEHVTRCLELLAVSNKATQASDDVVTVSTITERLKQWERELFENNGSSIEAKKSLTSLLGQLRILLHLCVMHIHPIPEESEASRQARSNLLATLCSMLLHPILQCHQDTVEFLFDLASVLADSLEDISLASIRVSGANKLPTDTRLEFIFGSTTNTSDAWLALESQVNPPGSQQQRALSKHPSQQLHPQMSGRPSPSLQTQQSPTMQLQQQHQRWPSQGGQPGFMRQDSRMPIEMKMTPFPLRRWEIMPDPTPVMGENDTSLSLGLFGARKA